MADRFHVSRIGVFLLLGGVAAATAAGTPSRRNPGKDVQELLRTRHISGCAVAVIREGRIVFMQPYGTANFDYDVPVGTDTVFELASVTKPFTAALVMTLARDGKLTLSDSIRKYVPRLPSSFGGISLLHLLTHTSGLPKDVTPNYWRSPLRATDLSRDEFLKLVSVVTLTAPPGHACSYSNVGYFLLGLAVEAAADRPFDEVLRSRILLPAKMLHTRVATRHDIIDRRATGYAWHGRFEIADYIGLAQHFANGGLVSTIGDMANFEVALQTRTVIGDFTVTQMLSPATLDDGKPAVIAYSSSGDAFTIGIGWWLGKYRGHRVALHLGDLPGFSAQFMRFLDDHTTVIALCNTEAGDDNRLHATIVARKIADEVIGDLSPISALERAIDAYAEKNYRQAAADYLEAIAAGRSNPVTLYNAACALALADRKDEAFIYLNRALAAGFSDMELLQSDSDLQSLRADPRWKSLPPPGRSPQP